MIYDAIIIGGGIVGMATALKLIEQKPDWKILVLEKESGPAMHQTGHNSGVIHSGIYYKPSSLKAQNCLRGYQMLLDFCNVQNIEYNLCGKVIVATQKSEIDQLDMIYLRGLANGLSKIRKIEKSELYEKEPYVSALAAIWVPYSGIIDYKKVTQTIVSNFEKLGGTVLYNQKVIKLIERPSNTQIICQEETVWQAKQLINCAGLYSDSVASMQIKELNTRIIPFRGEYYLLRPEKQYLINGLVYPVPDLNFPFLGVHFTKMISGGVEAGPNAVFAFKKEGYLKTDFSAKEFCASLAWPGFRKVAFKYWKTGLGEYYRSVSKSVFTSALQKLVPSLDKSDLVAGSSGVRAQACTKQGALSDDFILMQAGKNIHVINAPSPAATSAFSIGERITEMVIANS